MVPAEVLVPGVSAAQSHSQFRQSFRLGKEMPALGVAPFSALSGSQESVK